MINREIKFPFSKFPATRILALYALGIICARYITCHFSTTIVVVIYAGILSCFIIFDRLYKKKLKSTFRYASVISYSTLIVFTGFILTYNQKNKPASLEEEILSTYEWEVLKFDGAVVEVYGSNRIDARITSVLISDSLKIDTSFKAKVRFDSVSSLSPGDLIHLSGMILPKSRKRNPHDFDYQAYLESQGFAASITNGVIHSKSMQASTSSRQLIKNSLLSHIDQLFDKETAPIAKALLLGHKVDLEKDDRQSFSRSGLSHLMAVSGLHVGFIIAPLWVMITYIWSYSYGRHLGFTLLITILFLYSSLTGFTPSVVRASLTASLIIFSKLFSKSRDSINITSFSALIILLCNPLDLFSIGFQLSFGAVYIILLILPVIQSLLPKAIQQKWYYPLMMVVIVSVVVQIGLFPLQVYYFNEVSLISPLSNALFVPIMGLLVPFTMFCVGVSYISMPAALILNLPGDFILGLLQDYANLISFFNWSWIYIPTISVEIFFIWIFGMGCISAYRIQRARESFVILLCGSLIGLFVRQTINHTYTPELKVTFFDVGQGDAALIQTPGGENYLVDTGRWTPSYNSGQSVILPHLRAEGIEKLDAIFLSHPHSDHIGGMIDLINSIPIGHIYNSGFKYDSKLYTDYISLAKRREIPVQRLASGSTPGIDPSILILVYSPNTEIISNDPNEHSLIFELLYGETQFLFAGDGEHLAEESILKNYNDLLKTDVLKVGHHGSRTSSTQPFIDKVKPKYAIVSLGEKNFFGHPHKEALNRFEAAQIQPVFTSKEGALIFVSDGKKVRRQQWRE